MTVKGLYFFYNTSTHCKTLVLYYPFFIDSEHPYPEWIEVKGFDFVETAHGILIQITFPGCTTTPLVVQYRQKIYTSCAVYILTSTKHWSHPLRNAELIIIVPKEFEKVKISYSPDRCIINGDWMYFYITKIEFMPTKDLVICWE